MKPFHYNRKGYSIIEMLLATILVISLSGVSYRVLKSITMTQATNVAGQKSNKAADAALDRFKKDMSMVDYNWVRFGVASIYPHPGYSYDTNYYGDPSIRTQVDLSDGVTFLRRDPSNGRIYEIEVANHKLCHPVEQTVADMKLYGPGILLNTTDGLDRGDWVLVYQAGKYALAIIQSLNGNGVVLAAPPQSLRQEIAIVNNASTGIVSKAGVVPANMDFDGTVTGPNFDDSFCFDLHAPKLQKIAHPVSYFADFQTTDGQEKTSSNSYVLGKDGKPGKMLVRVEYNANSKTREYIAPIEQVEFSYDLLKPEDTSLPGGILRNVGHEKDNILLQVLSNSDPVINDLQFESSNKVVAVNMNLRLANQSKNVGDKDWKRAQELKVAIDPSLQIDMYRDHMDVHSEVTQDLNTIPDETLGYTYNQQLGKPAYLGNVPLNEEVMIPVNTFAMNDQGQMTTDSSGAIYVYEATTDPNYQSRVGCPVNDRITQNCTPSNLSMIKFNVPGGKTFFPNAITQTTLTDGSTRIFIGGVGMGTDPNLGVPVRSPISATIDLAPGETLASKLQNPLDGAPCSISGCTVQEIDNSSEQLQDLVDTANVSINNTNGDVYVATMTKKIGEESPSVIYKGTSNGAGGYNYSKVTDVPYSTDGRVVSAVGDHMVQSGGSAYLPVCLTKKINQACNGECLNDSNGANPEDEDDSNNDVYGRLVLIKDGQDPIVLMKHNYRCSSITVDNQNNLVIGGRLTAQMIKSEDIRNALTDSAYLAEMQSKVLYLDEVGRVVGGHPQFADYFTVDPRTYGGDSLPQDIGWLTGVSLFQYPDGTVGAVNANKYRLDPGASSVNTTNNTGSPKEYANVGIAKISMAGMTDRVVATIETNMSNINASRITATYSASVSEVPPIYMPGSFFTPSGLSGVRVTPTPLPSASPAMSDISWLDLYRQMISAVGDPQLNQGMPIKPTGDMTEFDCRHTYPKTTCIPRS